MPLAFRKFVKQCYIIIHCSEIFIEQPSDLLARAQVWNNYKHDSTVKFLIGITHNYHMYLIVLEDACPTSKLWRNHHS